MIQLLFKTIHGNYPLPNECLLYVFFQNENLEGLIPKHALTKRPQILSSCLDLRKSLLGYGQTPSMVWKSLLFPSQQTQTRDQKKFFKSSEARQVYSSMKWAEKKTFRHTGYYGNAGRASLSQAASLLPQRSQAKCYQIS